MGQWYAILLKGQHLMHHITRMLSVIVLCITEQMIRSCIQAFLIPAYVSNCAKFSNVVFGFMQEWLLPVLLLQVHYRQG